MVYRSNTKLKNFRDLYFVPIFCHVSPVVRPDLMTIMTTVNNSFFSFFLYFVAPTRYKIGHFIFVNDRFEKIKRKLDLYP